MSEVNTESVISSNSDPGGERQQKADNAPRKRGALSLQMSTGSQEAQEETADAKRMRKLEQSLEKSLPNIMFGYGDSKRPLKATAAVLANLAVDFVGEMTKKMLALAADRGDGELTYQNLLFLIRDDAYQYDRAWELKTSNEELRRAHQIVLAKDDTNT